jgi:hypothetical protein
MALELTQTAYGPRYPENEWVYGYIDDIDEHPKNPERLAWTFIVDDDNDPVWGSTSHATAPRSKIRKWWTGVMGSDHPWLTNPEIKVPLGELIGKRVGIMFVHATDAEGNTRSYPDRLKHSDDKPDLKPGETPQPAETQEPATTPVTNKEVPF